MEYVALPASIIWIIVRPQPIQYLPIESKVQMFTQGLLFVFMAHPDPEYTSHNTHYYRYKS
jgi:hypothetical protein